MTEGEVAGEEHCGGERERERERERGEGGESEPKATIPMSKSCH